MGEVRVQVSTLASAVRKRSRISANSQLIFCEFGFKL
jgi:hypothetical protein